MVELISDGAVGPRDDLFKDRGWSRAKFVVWSDM